MPSPMLVFARESRRWIPTENSSTRLTQAGREAWKRLVADDIRAATGAETVPDAALEELLALPPSPEWIHRYIYLPHGSREWGLVKVAVTPKVVGWREELIALCEHPVGLVRDVEFGPFDVQWSSDGFVAIRCDEVKGAIVGSVTVAASIDDYVVMLHGTSKDMLTVLEMKAAVESELADLTLI